jgi:hypothetical protein
MNDHPLNLTGTLDPELELLLLLNLLRILKMMQRILDPFKSKSQSKKRKRFYMECVKSDHKKFKVNPLRIFSIETTITILSWQIETSSIKCRV